MNVDQIGSDRKKRRFGPGLEYPNVNLNSISLYKGVFIEPLGDKFFCQIKSSDLTLAVLGHNEHVYTSHIIHNTLTNINAITFINVNYDVHMEILLQTHS